MRTQQPHPRAPFSPLHAALLYATRGWPVLPLHYPTDRGCSCRRRGCASIGKHPRTRDGVYDATTDLDEIEQIWSRRPEANVGIATGAIVVIDVDGADGLSALGELERAHDKLPPTASVTTGSGIHLYFDCGAREIGNSSGNLPAHIDVRGAGGHVVAPPSLHANGRRYRWQGGGPLATLPDWLAALLQPAPDRAPVAIARPRVRGRYVQRALDGELALVAAAAKGTRNTTLNRAAFRLGQLAGAGLSSAEELTDSLLSAARAAGLRDAESLATIASGLRAGQLRPRAVRQR
jgi:hypothetical protein